MTEAPPLILKRPRPARALISLVAMIDVLLILLVFFMVTSTYLDLDMIPAVSQDQQNAASADQAPPGAPVLIRIAGDGMPVIQGRTLSLSDLRALLQQRSSETPGLSVMILPTGSARTQALVSVMDAATQAGVRQVRVVRLEAQP